MDRYLGGRSEDLGARQNIGWDMAFGGAGIAVSGGVLAGSGQQAMEKCFDQVLACSRNGLHNRI